MSQGSQYLIINAVFQEDCNTIIEKFCVSFLQVSSFRVLGILSSCMALSTGSIGLVSSGPHFSMKVMNVPIQLCRIEFSTLAGPSSTLLTFRNPRHCVCVIACALLQA